MTTITGPDGNLYRLTSVRQGLILLVLALIGLTFAWLNLWADSLESATGKAADWAGRKILARLGAKS